MINLNNYKYDDNPYPYVICENIFDKNTYKDLVSNFPKIELFKDLSISNSSKFKKFALSERNNKNNFLKFLSSNETYKKLNDFINSENFKNKFIDEFLKVNLNIDFGIKNKKQNNFKKFLKDIMKFNWPIPNQKFKIAMEFSSIPTDGGFLAPHNDGTAKLVSIVLPIIDLDDEYFYKDGSGATSLLKVIDKNRVFNVINNTYKFEEVEEMKKINFKRNNLLIFFKTYNSVHAVYPLKKSDNKINFRNSITINIEKKYDY